MEDVAAQAEETIHRVAPALRRVTKYGAATYQGQGDVCTIGVWKSFVAVGFWSGAKLADRHAWLEGDGKASRMAKLRSVEDARSARFERLVRDAVKLDANEPAHVGRKRRPPASD
jgi:hypothetical protein